MEALDAVAPGRRFGSALDLGCGTGLMGARVRERVGRLEGVDLAPAMIEKARERGVYDALEVVDAVERLARTRGAFDLILAADTLPYLGDLAPAFAACRGALAPDGLFVFTAETIDGDGFRLLDGLRFAHAASYVESGLARRRTPSRPSAPRVGPARGGGGGAGAHRGGGGGVTAARLSCCGFAAVLCRGGIDAAGVPGALFPRRRTEEFELPSPQRYGRIAPPSGRRAALAVAPAFAAALLAGAALADDAVPAAPATSAGPWGVLSGDWQNATLLGDIGGLRPALAKYGLTLQLYEEAETFGNLTGGVRQGFEVNGVTTAQAQLDTKPLFGLPGGIVSVSGFHIWGGDLSASNLLNLQTVSGLETYASIRLWELWYQQNFGPNFDVKIGEQSLDNEFIMSQNAGYFLNSVMGWPMLPCGESAGRRPRLPARRAWASARARIRPTP